MVLKLIALSRSLQPNMMLYGKEAVVTENCRQTN